MGFGYTKSSVTVVKAKVKRNESGFSAYASNLRLYRVSGCDRVCLLDVQTSVGDL